MPDQSKWTLSRSENDPENAKEPDFYQLALQERIREAAYSTKKESTGCVIDLFDDTNESVVISPKEATCVEEIRLEGLWCVVERIAPTVLKSTFDDLKQRFEKTRNCSERLIAERMTLRDAIKDLTLNPNLSSLSEEAQYELAAIPVSPSYDVRFITAAILILYARNSAELTNLSKSGRCAGKSSGNKIDPKKYLKLKNIFCARVRKNAKTLLAGDDRIDLFEKLLVRAIAAAKKTIV